MNWAGHFTCMVCPWLALIRSCPSESSRRANLCLSLAATTLCTSSSLHWLPWGKDSTSLTLTYPPANKQSSEAL